ncbi:hypothetical protein MGYG_02308 [Nannizzia gypsea CBS 118893]|uniref:F-box domain-containing protein n=1 Tax=Arthroderma gypseum (strain ATCC MYA-4604 / CBS 118893) TaxID=535722 RepID=E4UQX0_ARTGP|nr:hypothetical protein MGYG_02308 [Nannizzia gypsea CBS 118893]EFQ99296.1 hypothetical protein MGYG_02308 [Nannizzia gypsea CBS 118893]
MSTEYRALLTESGVCVNPARDMKPEVSGVGLNYVLRFMYRAPLNFYGRWDDQGYDLGIVSRDPDDSVEFGRRTAVQLMQCRSGFIIHAPCYSLLEQLFSPEDVPVARLMEILWSCSTITCSLNVLDWGHEYGGTFTKYGPVEGDSEFVFRDPWTVFKDGKSLGKFVRRARFNDKRKKRQLLERSPAVMSGDAAPNHLSRLSLEILELIAVQLRTSDVLALSQVSKVLARAIPSGFGQSFWRSRFQPTFELGYMFEANMSNEPLNWRWLYFRCREIAPFTPELKNRMRIWKLLQLPVSELVALGWSGDPSLRPLNIGWHQLKWGRRGGLLRLHETPGSEILDFGEGCKEFYVQRTALPGDICQLIVTTIRVGAAPFVSGLRFVTEEGPDICLGYTRGGEKKYLDVVNGLKTPTGLRGFDLSVGHRGIHGLRAISQDGKCSEWAGLRHSQLRPKHLVVSKDAVIGLEAGFDLRLIWLAAITGIQNGPAFNCGRQIKRGKPDMSITS